MKSSKLLSFLSPWFHLPFDLQFLWRFSETETIARLRPPNRADLETEWELNLTAAGAAKIPMTRS